MACKTYRDWARETKGITNPEMYVFYLFSLNRTASVMQATLGIIVDYPLSVLVSGKSASITDASSQDHPFIRSRGILESIPVF